MLVEELAKSTELSANVTKANKKDAAGESASVEQNTVEEVKKELDKAVKNLNGSVVDGNQKLTNAVSDLSESGSFHDVFCNFAALRKARVSPMFSAKFLKSVLFVVGRQLWRRLACTAVDCNNRGTCIGTKQTHICACQLGFSGSSCEETVCDSNRDCNGRGICFGTTSSFTCICNLGFSGNRCERICIMSKITKVAATLYSLPSENAVYSEYERRRERTRKTLVLSP
ncbi:unnamed protein product [Strongylus vulgaris]|uniref:EGF-like domain-containing protein n=1 Tax=Strongylus vulgaris TaxID=40348 RepID=A0A3P7JDE3_STRVU|nr:unnamed protein product [Strongylus vulgaris]